MARYLPDGSIKLSDGRVIYADHIVLAADLCEIIPLFTPPPAWPFIGGGGGGSGPPGARGAPGPQGFQGANTSEFGVVGWTSPGDLTTTENDLFARIVLPVEVEINRLRATVETAPVGADIEIDIYLGTIVTGVLDGAPIGTIVIPAGSFYGEFVLAAVPWPITKFAVPAITQVGSVTPGATAAISVECQA